MNETKFYTKEFIKGQKIILAFPNKKDHRTELKRIDDMTGTKEDEIEKEDKWRRLKRNYEKISALPWMYIAN